MPPKICRICGGSNELKNILEQGPEMIEKLLKCANIQICTEEDLLPKLICQQCDANLELSFRLRKQSEETHRRLMDDIKNQTNPDNLCEKEFDVNDKVEDARDVVCKEEAQIIEADITNLFQTVQLPCTSIATDNYMEMVSEPSDIDGEDCNALVNDGRLESEIVSEGVIEDSSTESYEVYGSLENYPPSITIQSNCAYMEEVSNITHQNFASEIQIDDEDEKDDGNTELNNSLLVKQKEIVIDDDDALQGINQHIDEYHVMDDESQASQAIVDCSIDLVSSSSSEPSTGYCKDDTQRTRPINSLTCVTCHEVFATRKLYGEHIRDHGKQRHQCIQCCKFFPTRFRLERHELTHRDVSFFNCPHCDRCYRGLYNLERHIKSVHSNCKKLRCEICDAKFSRVDVLKRHMQLHSDEEPYKCVICLLSFKTLDYLYSHRKRKHAFNVVEDDKNTSREPSETDRTTKKFLCKFCGKLFKTLFEHKIHLLVHTNERPHECEICKKTFRTNTALTTHSRIHSDSRPYQCVICLKSFRQPSHLKQHTQLHSGDAPEYSCYICRAKFNKKGNLKTHIRTHTKDKPFKCVECGRTFTLRCLLKEHLNIVHGAEEEGTKDVDHCSNASNDLESPEADGATKDWTDLEEVISIDTGACIDFQADACDDVVELIDDNLSRSNVDKNERELIPQTPINDNCLIVADDSVADYIRIDSSNSSDVVESDLVANIFDQNIHISKQNLDIFVSDDTNASVFDKL